MKLPTDSKVKARGLTCDDWSQIWKEAAEKNKIEGWKMNTMALKNGDEAAKKMFEEDWDKAIVSNKKRSEYQALNPEQLNQIKTRNTECVEKNRYLDGPLEITENQMIAEGRKRYYADYSIPIWYNYDYEDR